MSELPTRNVAYPLLATSVTSLAQSFQAVLEATLSEEYYFEFNDKNTRNYKTLKYENQTQTFENISMNLNDAIETYINSGKKIQN